MVDKRTKAELDQQLQLAGKMGITSIPALFINGKHIPRWNDIEYIEPVIKNELKKSGH